MTTGQVVDTETAQEFMAQALEKVERAELGDIVRELEQKSARLSMLLAPESLPTLTRQQLRGLLRSVFATRRKADAILNLMGEADLREAIGTLLYGVDALPDRFQNFTQHLMGYWGNVKLVRAASGETEDLPESIFCDLAAELLHFTQPETHWLWTRWMWDPRVGTGALPLVTMEEYDLHGRDFGEMYMKVGVAVSFVRATGEAVGFARFGISQSPFGIDVFLACVYAIYMYTTLRIRMTQEFNKVVPQLPELTRRLLGVWKLEV